MHQSVKAFSTRCCHSAANCPNPLQQPGTTEAFFKVREIWHMLLGTTSQMLLLIPPMPYPCKWDAVGKGNEQAYRIRVAAEDQMQSSSL